MPHLPRHPKKVIRFLACLALALAAQSPLAPPTPALAGSPGGTFTVNTTGDTNVRDAVLSVREAVLVANGTLTGTFTSLEQTQLGGCSFSSGNIIGACGDSLPDTIILPAGTYLLSITGSNEDNSEKGDLDIFSEVTINGAGLGQTIIDGGGTDRVIDIFGGAVVKISGVIIQHGSVASANGGGLRIQVSEVSLSDGAVLSNTTDALGGGIYNNSLLDLTAMTISYNAAISNTSSGGGIYNVGQLTALAADTFYSNTAGSNGGGLANATGAGGTAVLANATVTSNSAAYGGGIFNTAQLTITHSYLSGNQAVYLGGGVRGEYSGMVIIDGSQLENNRGDAGGGALSGRQTTFTVTNSSLISNTASSGGGLWVYEAAFWLRNVTISGNRAEADGGGIYMDGGFANQVLGNNITVANNTADADNSGGGDGGGLKVNTSVISLTNSILAGNHDLSGTGSVYPDCAGPLETGGYNLMESLTGCTVVLTTGDLNGPAQLGPLQDNGGGSLTQAPLPGSPAVEAGSPTTPGTGSEACAAADQRG
ncbi:MAG: right-handed parallel beta-helix repeat-containing protein, partial [Anaerolineales bacterium]